MALAAVTLDAGGTVFDVAEPVGVTYARVAARHGLTLERDEAERRFRDAFAAAPRLAFPGVDPARRADHERAWWYAIVRATFGSAAEAPGFDACFAELFESYAEPGAWRVFPDVWEALPRIRRHGLRIALVSNFDERLVGLVAGLGLAPLVDLVLPSSRAGAAKPDPAIFHAALAALGVAPAAAVHVGDGLVADVEGARAAGLRAVLIERTGRRRARLPSGVSTISALSELPALLGLELA
jgi:putative hydrolase of the HAD superfamily